MNEFNKTDLSKAFNAGVDAIALECNKRIHKTREAMQNSIVNDYGTGYIDALGELLEWMEYDMKDKK